MLEHEERRQGLPVHVARLEDGHQLRGELLQLLGPALTGIEAAEVQGDEGGVVGHVAVEEFVLDLAEGGFGEIAVAEARRNPAFRPSQTDQIQGLGDSAQEVAYLGKATSGFLVATRCRQAQDEVMASIDRETRVFLYIDEIEGAREQLDRSLKIAPVFQHLGLRDQGSTHSMWVTRLLVKRICTIQEAHRFGEISLGSSEGCLELKDFRLDLDIAGHARGEEALRISKG